MKHLLTLFLLCFCMVVINAQKTEQDIIKSIDAKYIEYSSIARKIWEFAELGFLETKSTALLQETLKQAGFTIETGVAEMPTAFVASYGQGKPIIGILGEFDALPGVSQDAVPERKTVEGRPAGHACGHHLFGTASTAAVIAVKNWLVQNKKQGTIRFYGTPAEEGGCGKVYMIRAGLFNDVDAVLHWHPSSENQASAESSLAIVSGKFRFYGVASHAAAAPERGRSALDGVEAMNNMVNLMREHVPEQARIHYIISEGGEAPNVVPAFAEVEYVVRHPHREVAKSIWDWVVKAAQGAAMGTETKMESEIMGGLYNLMPNAILAKAMDASLHKVGGYTYTSEERAFAQKIQQTFTIKAPALETTNQVDSFEVRETPFPASTDVGDVSWVVPTAGLDTATWVPGTSAHSWQAVAAGGMSIGYKGMMVAAKTVALTAINLYDNPKTIEEAWKELKRRRGADFKYESLLGDRKPPLDFRK